MKTKEQKREYTKFLKELKKPKNQSKWILLDSVKIERNILKLEVFEYDGTMRIRTGRTILCQSRVYEHPLICEFKGRIIFALIFALTSYYTGKAFNQRSFIRQLDLLKSTNKIQKRTK